MKSMHKQISGVEKNIPVLTKDELRELEKIMYLYQNDELLERRFWKEVYEKRELKYEKN